MEKHILVDVGGERIRVCLLEDQLSVSGENSDVSLAELRPHVYSLLLNGQSHLIHVGDGPDNLLTINGETVKSRTISERSELILRYGQQTGDHRTVSELRAPMPGLIMKIMVQTRDPVSKGDGLVVLEAMKMENELRSPCTGHVKHVYIQEKDVVTLDTLLMEFE